MDVLYIQNDHFCFDVISYLGTRLDMLSILMVDVALILPRVILVFGCGTIDMVSTGYHSISFSMVTICLDVSIFEAFLVNQS